MYEKSKILVECESGVTVTTLAKKYGVIKSTICFIKEKKTGFFKQSEWQWILAVEKMYVKRIL